MPPTTRRLSTAIMDALEWDCAHTGQEGTPDGRCAECSRLRDAIVAAAEQVDRPRSRFAPTEAKLRDMVVQANNRYALLGARIMAARHALRLGQSTEVVLAILDGATESEGAGGTSVV